MGRRVLGSAILLIWLAMVGWQVREEYFQPELARLADAALSLAPGVNFYTLTMGGRTVGQATSRLDTLPDGFELEDFMNLELPALGQTGTAVARTRVKMSPSLVMEEFSFSLESEVGRFEATGTLGADTTLRVQINSAGSVQNLEFRLPQPPIFSAVLPIRVAVGEGLVRTQFADYPLRHAQQFFVGVVLARDQQGGYFDPDIGLVAQILQGVQNRLQSGAG